MGDFEKSKLSSLGGFLPVYHSPRGKGFFLSWLTLHFWAGKRGFLVNGMFGEEKWDFQVLLDVSSPRRTSVCLGGGVNLHTEDCCYT